MPRFRFTIRRGSGWVAAIGCGVGLVAVAERESPLADMGMILILSAVVFLIAWRPSDFILRRCAEEAPVMRVHRFRFTIRRMMVAVAVVAVAIALGTRSVRFATAAAKHEERMRLARQELRSHERPFYGDERANHHAAMKAKYDRAARYPWLAVAPDPPDPE